MDNFQKLQKKGIVLYNLYKKDLLRDSLKSRCCNYPLLEEKCLEFNQSLVEI